MSDGLSASRTGIFAADATWLASLSRRMPLGLALGVLVLLVLTLAADAPSVAAAVGRFEWQLLPAILGLTLLNYLVRFVKWGYYLRLIGAPTIARGPSMLIFFAGLAMTITPGKVGEWLKSYLLRQRYGIPFSVSAPIVVAERLTDGLAMLLLALGGLLAYGLGRELLLLVALAALALVAFTQMRAMPLALLEMGERLPLLRGRVEPLRAFYESSYRLFRLGPLLLAIAMGLISWGSECVAFYLVLVGLGIPASPELLLQSAFVLAVATLAGSASMLPGGLAVAEGSLAGLLLLLAVTSEPALAAAATLLIRFGTLWFGVAVGALALFILGRVRVA